MYVGETFASRKNSVLCSKGVPHARVKGSSLFFEVGRLRLVVHVSFLLRSLWQGRLFRAGCGGLWQVAGKRNSTAGLAHTQSTGGRYEIVGGITILAVSVPHFFGTRRALKLDRSDINIIRMRPQHHEDCELLQSLYRAVNVNMWIPSDRILDSCPCLHSTQQCLTKLGRGKKTQRGAAKLNQAVARCHLAFCHVHT